ncbi:MAG: hypothetical protein N3A63_02395 [Bacteroidetes bacterium]|nr:hypothetical protein [Bacteroidota bacterium]
MTTTALIIMLGTWAVISYFTVRFFLRIFRSPHLHNPTEDALEDQLKE